MPKIQELGNTGYVLSPPPPPSGTAESSRPASPESPLDHQIDVFDRTVDPFIIRLTGIEDVELQEREVHIAKMGNAPTDSEEVRKSKSFEFMNELWYKAEDIFNNSRDAIIQKMAEQGKEFSELAGKAIVFANLLMQNVSNSKCISCQMPTSNGPEKLFFPIEVIKKPEEYVNVVKKLASAVKELPKQDPRSFLQVIHEKVLRGLDDDFAEERDQKLEVFGVDDWCDARLALDPGILRDVVNSCVKSYIEYRQATQIEEGVDLMTMKMTLHTVRAGDSLSKIAHAYGVTVKSLKEINNLSSNKLMIGQELIVQRVLDYTVKPGDRLGSIAKRFHIKQADLREVNDIDNSNELRVGQKLSFLSK